MRSTDYCAIAGVPVPSLERVARERRPGTYGLLLVALLERGGPATLAEVAEQFAAAGIAPAPAALRALRACRPGRPPIYRDGAHYALDPHDAAVEGWALRLGLLPPMLPRASGGEASRAPRGKAGELAELAELATNLNRWARERARRVTELALRRHALVHAHPASDPVAIVVVDLDRGGVAHFDRGQGGALREHLARYQVWAGVGIRSQIRVLGLTPGDRKLAELAPPQKSVRVDGRPFRITLAALVQSSCQVTLEPGVTGNETVQRRLLREANALRGYYRFSRLHHAVRLHCRGRELWMDAPWIDPDEVDLADLLRDAWKQDLPLEAVLGAAPDGEDPWSASIPCRVASPDGEDLFLVDAHGHTIADGDIQLLRPRVPMQ